MSDTGWVLLARLVRPQGRKGEIIADIFTDFPELFATRSRVFLQSAALPNGKTAPATIQEALIERHWLHQGRIVFKFQGIDSINEAEPLRGLDVVIPSHERAPLEEDAVYIGDLIGCRVIDVSIAPEIEVGEITDVERGLRGAPDLLVVRPAARPTPVQEIVAEPVDPDAARPRRGKRAPKPVELLIPFARRYLVSIDIAAKRVQMRLPTGLADLNAAGSAEDAAGKA